MIALIAVVTLHASDGESLYSPVTRFRSNDDILTGAFDLDFMKFAVFSLSRRVIADGVLVSQLICDSGKSGGQVAQRIGAMQLSA